jgi:hypothetical protein
LAKYGIEIIKYGIERIKYGIEIIKYRIERIKYGEGFASLYIYNKNLFFIRFMQDSILNIFHSTLPPSS